MPEDWISWGVAAIVVIAAMAIFYKALKEPVDLVLGAFKRMFQSIFGRLQNAGGGDSGGRIIEYG